MELGLLMFPNPTGSADMARLVEGLGFRSMVFADTQCLTPEVWSQLMLAASATERIQIGTGVTNPVSRDPDMLRFGAYINCVINPDREVAREAIRGGLSVFAHFSGFHGMDINSLPEGSRAAARHLRSHYDMANHAVAAGAHAQALDAEFIHRFGIAGPLDEATARFREIGESGIEFVRVIPGSRDMPAAVAGPSIRALAKVVGEVGS